MVFTTATRSRCHRQPARCDGEAGTENNPNSSLSASGSFD
jgi:hypothetical protein